MKRPWTVAVAVFGLFVATNYATQISPSKQDVAASDTVMQFNDLVQYYNIQIMNVDLEAQRLKARLQGQFEAYASRRDSAKGTVVVPKSLFRKP